MYRSEAEAPSARHEACPCRRRWMTAACLDLALRLVVWMLSPNAHWLNAKARPSNSSYIRPQRGISSCYAGGGSVILPYPTALAALPEVDRKRGIAVARDHAAVEFRECFAQIYPTRRRIRSRRAGFAAGQLAYRWTLPDRPCRVP